MADPDDESHLDLSAVETAVRTAENPRVPKEVIPADKGTLGLEGPWRTSCPGLILGHNLFAEWLAIYLRGRGMLEQEAKSQ